MLKTLPELNKEEKLLLLEAIANKEIDKAHLTPESLFATEYKDYFRGLMIAGSQPDNESTTIICLGAARLAQENMRKIETIELVNGSGEITDSIMMTKDNLI